MDTQQIIDELEQTAQQLGFEVRREKGNFRGGRCQKGDTELIMLNKRHLPETQLAVLADALRDTPIDTVYMKPAVREALEATWAERDDAAAERAAESAHAE
jgi:hypothetical protein